MSLRSFSSRSPLLFLFFVLLAAFGAPRAARADAAPVVVVEVSPTAAKLDADRLRRAIGEELHARAVEPGAPGADAATGVVTVSVEGGELVVSYVARATPTTRRIALPPNDDTAREVAVSLAGNLARDEAGELTAELGRQKPAPPAPRPAPPRPPPAANDASDERVGLRLHDTLAYHYGEERRRRLAVGWTSLGVGLAGSVGAAYLENQSDARLAGQWAGVTSTFLLGWGFGQLVFGPTPYEDLVAMGQKGEGVEAVEQAWARAADREHTGRLVGGIAGLALSGVLAGIGTFVLVDRDLDVGSRAREETVATLYALGGVGAVWSVAELAGDGPVEGGLHAYERATARTVRTQGAAAPRLGVAVVPLGGASPGSVGGGMASLALTF